MRYVKPAVLGAAIVAGLCWQGAAGAAVLYSIDIDRTSADPEVRTFSGSGLLGFDGPGVGLDDIGAFSLEIETIGGAFAGPDRIAVPRQFVFGPGDILAVTGLVRGASLGGVIALAGKLSEDGAVQLGEGTLLDFTGGIASGFCFDASGGAECILGGGTSSDIEANLGSAIVPLPWTLTLLLSGLGGLWLVARARAAPEARALAVTRASPR